MLNMNQAIADVMFATAPRADNGIAIDAAFEAVKARHEAMRPEDRTMKLKAFAYGGESPFAGVLAGSPVMAETLNDVTGGGLHYLTEGAFKQLAGFIGPKGGDHDRINFAGYVRACPEKLKLVNMNYWLQANGEQPGFVRTVRAGNGDRIVRAVRSERYAAIDDFEVFSLLRTLEDELRGANVRLLQETEGSFNLSVSWARDRREVKKGDIVETGFRVRNGETGLYSVSVMPYVNRLVCANGMVRAEGGDKWTIRHIGNPDRVRNALGEAIRAALPAARETVDRLAFAVREMVDEPARVLKAIALNEGLTQAMLDTAIDELIGEVTSGNASKFDIVNAVTATARRQENPERRFELERLGGKLLFAELPAPAADDSKIED